MAVNNINKPFIVQSKKAYILKNDPDVVYMSNMKVTLYMNDGRIVIITSDKGNYNKENYDCFFENNVKATDGRTTIKAENLDFEIRAILEKMLNEVKKKNKIILDSELKVGELKLLCKKKNTTVI